jgi:hypothetical protein
MFRLRKEIDDLEENTGRVMKLFAVIPQAMIRYALCFVFLQLYFLIISSDKLITDQLALYINLIQTI